MAVLKKAKGLHTFGNEINDVEGALDVADNVVIDADDTIESRRGFKEFGDSFGTASDTLNQVFSYKGRILRHYNSLLEYDSTGSGSFNTFSGSYDELIDGLRMKSQEANSNFFFTTNDGIKKISASNATQLSTVNPTDAGGIKAIDGSAELKFTSGGFLSPQSKCAYRVVWGSRDNNNNLILGSPSSRFILTNNSIDISTPEQFDLTFGSGTVTDYDGTADDRYVTFDSVNNEYFLWFSSTAFPDAPQDSETIGRIAIEANIEGLSGSGNITVAAATAISSATSEFSVEVSGSIVTVTSNETGQNITDASSSVALTAVVTTIVEQGSVSEGDSANATINITVPTDVDSTDYFYQLYRTAPLTVIDGSLEDIDPGDEMNLAFEANITTAEISAGEVIFEDITTESFRGSGAYLYTNPNTGDGILQANERPPIARDIELFRNSTFYSNTKTSHRLTLNLLSVTAFTSGISDIVIGNSSLVSSYSFVGAAEEFDITTDSFANTTDTGYILLNSASDERKYYIWFDKGSTTDPAIANRVGIRVQIYTGNTDADIATLVASIINLFDDFTASSSTNTVTITNAKNGNTTDASIGAALGGAWAVAVTTQGDGEDAGSNEVLLSSEASAGQSIDETARSLVKIINKDSVSPVNAFYLSGVNDLPGIIFLESRSLTDDPFFVATSDSAITNQFNPELPTVETITAIATGDPSNITSAGHGLTTGETVYIYGTDSTPSLQGEFEVTVVDPNTFSVSTAVLLAGTTGFWFKSDAAPSDNEVSPNRLFYSKTSQPEAVPIVNYIDIGPQDKEIQRILALRDNLFVLKEDGIYIVTGTTAPNFSSRLLDGSTQLIAPDTAVVLSNKIYALSTQGIVAITEGGVSIISRPIEDRIQDITNDRHDFKYTSFGVSYESDRAFIMWLPSTTTDTVATQAYRYNTFTRTWTRWTNGATCGIVNDNDRLYVAPNDRNYLDEERKTRDRTDYADRDFALSIPFESVNENVVSISSVSDLDIGDVLVQTQYLTISEFNRLLRKLDIDPGLDDSDYESSLAMVAGGNLTSSMDQLNTKLVADDASGNITATSYSADFETLQTEYNVLISELNLPSTDTGYKNYVESQDTKGYEVIVIDIASSGNKITVTFSMPFLEGTIQAYKGIQTEVEWAPQHFGASDVLKQVREGTIIFDQNNFYSGVLSYASDRSFNFEQIPFLVQNVGFWGGNIWGQGVWGGLGNEIPVRTLIPRDKQRCRHIRIKFEHINARERFRIVGISLEPRVLSKRAYR